MNDMLMEDFAVAVYVVMAFQTCTFSVWGS